VLDLRAWFDLPRRDFSVNQKIIVLRHEQQVLGVIADDVHDVRPLAFEHTEPTPEYSVSGPAQRVLTRIARLEEKILFLPDRHKLFRFADGSVESDCGGPEETAVHPAIPDTGSISTVTEKVQAILRERAKSLLQSGDPESALDNAGLAVISLNGDYFGVPLETIREFAEMRGLTPVPCCPPHILGNMNLRGEVVTIIDIRAALEMQSSQEAERGCVMVVQSGDITAGIQVDDALEAVYLKTADIAPLPASANGGKQYIAGSARYGSEALNIIDVRLMLADPRWIVDETV
jgi:purine-binding chemotaxis protein CheW